MSFIHVSVAIRCLSVAQVASTQHIETKAHRVRCKAVVT